MQAAPLPIEEVLEPLKQVLKQHYNAILIAQPGAGKTTRVPMALLNEPWMAGRKLIMLEPRRLSARAAAHYIASQLGEAIGETVGYRMHNDTRVGPATRIEVVTEGVLTRMLLADPMLSDVGLVIFDEFHERSLHADTGAALLLHARSLFDHDIRIVFMSATLEGSQLAKQLDAPILSSDGRAFPVETHYLKRPLQDRMEEAVTRAVRHALQAHTGDILVFLPGIREIHGVQRLLQSVVPAGCAIMPLYGDLAVELQTDVLKPCGPGERKVVLATPIAETGLTVAGIRVVIDSGLIRTARFSPKTGMSRLETIVAAQASADQRRGRAGRTSPGVCYRLWTEEEHQLLPLERTPEIQEADLAPLALLLAEWGARPDELVWLTDPPTAHYEQAERMLKLIGALTEDGKITEHGRRMNQLGVHPRVAHMLLRARELGHGSLACALAAILGERDLIKGERSRQVDIRLRLALITQSGAPEHNDYDVDNARLKQIRESAKRLREKLSLHERQPVQVDQAGLLLSLAYPDRIAVKRGSIRYLLSSGRGAVLPQDQWLRGMDYLAVGELDDSGADSRIWQAAPIMLQEIMEHHQSRIVKSQEVVWDETARCVKASFMTRLGAITLSEQTSRHVDQELLLQACMEGLRIHGLRILPWTKSNMQLRERIATLHHMDPSWPDVSDAGLLEAMEQWFAPYAGGYRSLNDFARLPLHDALRSLLNWEQQRDLDKLAPTHYKVPSGSRVAIQYANPEAPYIAVKLQELFGLTQTPLIANGRLALTLQLLSPAGRPVQITSDLISFWHNTYYEVKKDLKGRYPKHYWPDDPMSAVATNRIRPTEGPRPKRRASPG